MNRSRWPSRSKGLAHLYGVPRCLKTYCIDGTLYLLGKLHGRPLWTTPGGGVICAPPDRHTHVVITVRDGGRSFEYGLMGGP